MRGNFATLKTILVFLPNFLLRMHRNGYKSTSAQILNQKFEIPMDCFLFDYKIWWHFCQEKTQDLCVFEQKTAFVMQNFGIWRLLVGG